MVGEACLPSNAYYPRTPDYTLCSGVHVCWSEHSDSSFVYGFMILNYGFGTMTATTSKGDGPAARPKERQKRKPAVDYRRLHEGSMLEDSPIRSIKRVGEGITRRDTRNRTFRSSRFGCGRLPRSGSTKRRKSITRSRSRK